jgi:hypothetical protein
MYWLQSLVSTGKKNCIEIFLTLARRQWLTPAIIATQEAEIRRIAV